MLPNICRVCGIDADTIAVKEVPTYLFEKSARKLLRQIQLLTGLLLESKQQLPEVICVICKSDLDCAMEFRRRCLRNHKRWTQPKTKLNATGTHVLCVRRSARISREQSPSKARHPIEVLIEVEQPNTASEDDDGIDHLDMATYSDALDFSDTEDELYEPPSKNTEGKRRCAKGTKPKCAKRNTFICDQCGRHFCGRAAFERHLRKHSGIRPYVCNECPARFLSTGELKSHQEMHSSNRLYFPCRYCDRTYVNYSGRLRHERTHTNERPYACNTCGKAFTNSYILKNHMLVHTGKRMFKCETCERSFLRITHLQTHYRSRTHKQNV
ncbi:CG8159, partial [Drosophila busckii]